MVHQSNKRKIDLFRAADISQVYQVLFESYHHDSDLLAELLQNAVDSIRMAKFQQPHIEIKFYEADKKISVRDNGLGMSEDDLKGFALGVTDKKPSKFSNLGGEKGLGAAFILGGSDEIFIDSCKDGHHILAECLHAYDSIKERKTPDFFVIEDRDFKSENYTEITVKGKLFYTDFANRDELENMLRSNTAIGYTKSLFGKPSLNINVKLAWIASDGEESSKVIHNEYHHPVIEGEDKVVEYEDAPNIESGYGKLLKYVDNEQEVCAVFGERELFNQFQIEPGIALSVKGYPASVDIKPPQTSYALYWRNVFILVNDDVCTLDAGRKSVTNDDLKRIRKKAVEAFNKLTKFHKKFILTTQTEAEKAVMDSLKEEARRLPNLRIEKICYRKIPNYEQGIVAVFHQLIGSGRLKGYQSLSSSSDTKYDEIILYEVPLEELGQKFRESYLRSRRNIKEKTDIYRQIIVAEYKLHGNEIIRDTKKDLKHLDLLIAYDFETSKLKKGWQFIPVEENELIYIGAKYKLINPLNDSCFVLLLKDFEEESRA